MALNRGWGAGSALLLAGCLALTSCTGGGASGAGTTSEAPQPASTDNRVLSTFESERLAGLQKMLDAWAQAQRDGDLEALNRVFHHRANSAFIADEQRRTEHIAAVPVAEWRYEVTSAPEIFVPGDVADQVGAANIWAPRVRLVYRLEGERTPVRREFRLLAAAPAAAGGAWSLVDNGTLVAEVPEWRLPWDFGPVRTDTVPWRGANSLVLGHPGDSDIIAATVGHLPGALDAADDFWKQQWDSTVVVYIAGSHEEFSALTGGFYDHSPAAAIAIADVRRNEPADSISGAAGHTVSGQRIVVSAPAFRQLDAKAQLSVLRHELTHVITRAVTDPATPLWLVEGTAEYVGRKPMETQLEDGAPLTRALVQSQGPPDRLPRDDHFRAGGQTTSLAYELAWTFAVFLAEKFGKAAIPEIFAELAAPGSGQGVVDERMRQATGETLAELVGEWGQWLVERMP
ncbi:hypothetical protein ONR57_18985 [Hoyosella sp. YIM 151337]|uniref:hypothetical protein n=1 Tax=Hoyosella sp. YIM 151337 TaxID=2992742 RepID=UPI002235E83A|nr:hypothetical protein [Hoyosella sp. YIM 151337]MCW4355392.1 hypothetical protein [Hoyosella sp. YIM 151337]